MLNKKSEENDMFYLLNENTNKLNNCCCMQESWACEMAGILAYKL